MDLRVRFLERSDVHLMAGVELDGMADGLHQALSFLYALEHVVAED